MNMHTITPTEFSHLFQMYQPRMQRLAFRYVSNMSVAEDMVADSFMALYENRDKAATEKNLPAYIFSIVRNKCLNYLRNERRRLEIEKKIYTAQILIIQDNIRSFEISDPEKIFSEEIASIVADSLFGMTELTRKIFVGIRLDEKSYKQVAQENNISTVRVNNELRRALKILRIALVDFLCIVWLLKHMMG